MPDHEVHCSEPNTSSQTNHSEFTTLAFKTDAQKFELVESFVNFCDTSGSEAQGLFKHIITIKTMSGLPTT